MGPVVCGELRAGHQGRCFHQAVHVDREHLHGARQDQLNMDTCITMFSDLFILDVLVMLNQRLPALQVLLHTDLAGGGWGGAVLPVTGQHVGCLADQDVPHIL